MEAQDGPKQSPGRAQGGPGRAQRSHRAQGGPRGGPGAVRVWLIILTMQLTSFGDLQRPGSPGAGRCANNSGHSLHSCSRVFCRLARLQVAVPQQTCHCDLFRFFVFVFFVFCFFLFDLFYLRVYRTSP